MKVIKRTRIPNQIIRTECKHCGAIIEFETDEATQYLREEERQCKFNGILDYFFANLTFQKATFIMCRIMCPVCNKAIVVKPKQEVEWSKPYGWNDPI